MFYTIKVLKQMLLTNFMYKYVEFNTDICLGYFIFCLKRLYISKHNFMIFTSEWNLFFSLLGKPNGFQYSLVTISYYYFIIINATLVQIFLCERNCKGKINIKIPLTNNCKKWWIPQRDYFNWNNVGNGDMSSSG